jgi:pyroglutamyl-peptidase
MGKLNGLVTGFGPFAGLPSNPAELVLPFVDGLDVGGATIVARPIPVSLSRLPIILPALVDEYRPIFVVALGLALGASVVRVEKIAINACHFEISDEDGARPYNGLQIAEGGPAARLATWNAEIIASALVEANIPARTSFHAGTHLCNFTLYTLLGALEARGLKSPCGMLHLPLTPEHVAWLLRQRDHRMDGAAGSLGDMASMALDIQVRAVTVALQALARELRSR